MRRMNCSTQKADVRHTGGGRDAGDKGSGRKAGRDFKAVDTGEQPYRVFWWCGGIDRKRNTGFPEPGWFVQSGICLSARDHHQP